MPNMAASLSVGVPRGTLAASPRVAPWVAPLAEPVFHGPSTKATWRKSPAHSPGWPICGLGVSSPRSIPQSVHRSPSALANWRRKLLRTCPRLDLKVFHVEHSW